MKNVIFIWCCVNTIVCKFDDFNIDTVNTIQKKLASCTKRARKFTFLTLTQYVYCYSSFHLPAIHFSISICEGKLWRHISFSSTCFCYYRKKPNNEHKIFPLLSFKLCSHYLSKIEIWRNLNEQYYYLTSASNSRFVK